jgi:hypothetical protein
MTLNTSDLQTMELELRRLRLETPTNGRGQKLRELTLRVADMRRACWGD